MMAVIIDSLSEVWADIKTMHLKHPPSFINGYCACGNDEGDYVEHLKSIMQQIIDEHTIETKDDNVE